MRREKSPRTKPSGSILAGEITLCKNLSWIFSTIFCILVKKKWKKRVLIKTKEKGCSYVQTLSTMTRWGSGGDVKKLVLKSAPLRMQRKSRVVRISDNFLNNNIRIQFWFLLSRALSLSHSPEEIKVKEKYFFVTSSFNVNQLEYFGYNLEVASHPKGAQMQKCRNLPNNSADMS